MSIPTTPDFLTQLTEQEMQNLSFDKDFNVLVAEILGFDGTDLIRVQVDSTGILQLA